MEKLCRLFLKFLDPPLHGMREMENNDIIEKHGQQVLCSDCRAIVDQPLVTVSALSLRVQLDACYSTVGGRGGGSFQLTQNFHSNVDKTSTSSVYMQLQAMILNT